MEVPEDGVSHHTIWAVTRKEMLNTVKKTKGILEITRRKGGFKTSQQKEN